MQSERDVTANDRAFERELEAETIALNRWLYAAGVGLDVDPAGFMAPAGRQAALYAHWLDSADPARRYCALEGWSEARRLDLDQKLETALDEAVVVPGLGAAGQPLTWRTWRSFERTAAGPAELSEGFNRLIDTAEAVTPLLEERWEAQRLDFARHGASAVEAFCWREAISAPDLRAFLTAAGQEGRAPFRAALGRLSEQVFGRAPGPAELRALYLHRMYEPHADLFPSGTDWTADTLGAFGAAGYNLDGLEVDLAPRPRKAAGAFCFPVVVPTDVRVSVAAPAAGGHFLVDLLYHEFGHAVHFSGISGDLPFVDRYWIHAGTHETLATLFEYWLAEPEFLAEHFHLGDRQVLGLAAFAGFKQALTATWHSAAALTSLDAWEAGLSWAAAERKLAAWLEAFTGIVFPPGFARLHPYVSTVSVYPAGYVLAEARTKSWIQRLRDIGGPRWWRSAEARADIFASIQKGGRLAAASPPWG